MFNYDFYNEFLTNHVRFLIRYWYRFIELCYLEMLADICSLGYD